MPRNEHKKVLQQLSEAYQNVLNEGGQPAGGIRSFREKPPRMDAFAQAELAKKQDAEYDPDRHEDSDHLAAAIKKKTRYWMAKEGQVGQRMTAEQAFKVAIKQIGDDHPGIDLGKYTIDNIGL